MAKLGQPEWITERGIGEQRALLVQGETVLAAKLQTDGEIQAGSIVSAKLTSKHRGSPRGTALAADGTTILIDKLPRDTSEGAELLIELTRAPIAERGRLKHAQGRPCAAGAAEGAAEGVAEGVAKIPAHTGHSDPFDPKDEVYRFPSGLWEEVWDAASAGEIAFAGGSILVSVTPAMTVIDIDGDLPARDLAIAAIPAIVQATDWFDLGGNIGIDFPTLQAKADRKMVDRILGDALVHWAHESTAMNGFGFVQLVARLKGPSLLHRFAGSRTAMCARKALRVAEQVEGPGVTLLTLHPALKSKLVPEWLEQLRRRTGREIRIETNPGLALEAPHAQIVSA